MCSSTGTCVSVAQCFEQTQTRISVGKFRICSTPAIPIESPFVVGQLASNSTRTGMDFEAGVPDNVS